jgi:hypothetical protein
VGFILDELPPCDSFTPRHTIALATKRNVSGTPGLAGRCMISLQPRLTKSTATHALTRRRTGRLGVSPSELFLEMETPHHVVSPDDMARSNMSLDGNIPRLYQLAAMRMRFVLDCTSDPVSRSRLVMVFRLRRLSHSRQQRVPHDPVRSSILLLLHQVTIEDL